MAKGKTSLSEYARRRFVLSGTLGVKSHFPYCRPMQELGVARPGLGSGCVSFAHYDYLGLAFDQRVLAAAAESIGLEGIGAGASRLVGGELASHRALERELSSFLEVEDTLCLVSGYGTNVALVGHLLAKDDLILVDEASHNSIMVGTQLSRARAVPFRHNDTQHLAELLGQLRHRHTRALVVVEGLYSMDGDIPDLPRLLSLCRQHDAWLMIDEAHSIGVLGEHGRGITEHYGIAASEVDLIVGTLSKAFVSVGGFVAARAGVIDWLRSTMPGFVYSVGLPPPSAAAARTALSILRAEPERLCRLVENSVYFVHGARRRGLDVGDASGAAVIPLLFGDTQTAMAAANAALEAGYFVPPIVQIAVPRDRPRLRFFITAGHSREQMDGVLDALRPFAAEPEGDRRPLDEATALQGGVAAS